MAIDINFLAETANSLVTVTCGLCLLYFIIRGKLQRHRFYYGWSAGFILYGVYIFLRPLTANVFIVDIPMVIAFLFFFPFSMFALNSQKNVTVLFLSVLFIGTLFVAFSYFGYLNESVSFWILSSVIFYLPITLVILAHRKIFGSSVDKFLIGWVSLFLVNIFFPLGDWITNTLAIVCKLFLFVGLMNYDFAIATQKIRKGLTLNALSPISGNCAKDDGGFELVMLKSRAETPLNIVSKWIIDQVEKNISQNVETTILILQDVLPYNVVRSIVWSKPDLIRVLFFSDGVSSSNQEFKTLKLGITEIGATINEVAKSESKTSQCGEIIIVDLSIMIYKFGVNQVYDLLLNKMGILRSNGITLLALFHPQAHEDRVVALFKTIANRITNL
jgi:hypothetical protein